MSSGRMERLRSEIRVEDSRRSLLILEGYPPASAMSLSNKRFPQNEGTPPRTSFNTIANCVTIVYLCIVYLGVDGSSLKSIFPMLVWLKQKMEGKYP